MKKFEYIIKNLGKGIDEYDFKIFLKNMGEDGWELCVWERYIDGSTYIFKREIV